MLCAQHTYYFIIICTCTLVMQCSPLNIFDEWHDQLLPAAYKLGRSIQRLMDAFKKQINLPQSSAWIAPVWKRSYIYLICYTGAFFFLLLRSWYWSLNSSSAAGNIFESYSSPWSSLITLAPCCFTVMVAHQIFIIFSC